MDMVPISGSLLQNNLAGRFDHCSTWKSQHGRIDLLQRSCLDDLVLFCHAWDINWTQGFERGIVCRSICKKIFNVCIFIFGRGGGDYDHFRDGLALWHLRDLACNERRKCGGSSCWFQGGDLLLRDFTSGLIMSSILGRVQVF